MTCENRLQSNLKELDDVDDPGAQPRGRRRLRPDELGVELRVFEVGLEGGDDVGVDVLLLVVDQALKELVDLKQRIWDIAAANKPISFDSIRSK